MTRIRVRSRAWLAAHRALLWLWRPFAALRRRIRPPVEVRVAWAPDLRAATAVDRIEALLEKKGHRALGLPTPPKDRRKRREWIIRMAQRTGARR